jgi:tetratricopeptide (TPR) repeat protein
MVKKQSKTSNPLSPRAVEGGAQIAEGKLVEEIKKNPKNVRAISTLANLYMEKNELFSAISFFQRAIQLTPSSYLFNELGLAYRKTGRPDLALSSLARAVALDANNASALFNYGGVLHGFGASEKALECIRAAGEKEERLRVPAIAASAMIKEGMGRVDEAFADIINLVNEGHKDPMVLQAMGTILQQHTKFSEHIDRAINLLSVAFEEKTINPLQQNSFYFLLGNLCQKKKDYDRAFSFFEKGHQHTFSRYNEDQELAVIDRICQSWSAVDTATVAVNKPGKQKLFFIVGMPRSGSTLVEQILAVYPESASLGESLYFYSSLTELFGNNGSDPVLKGGRPFLADEARTIRSFYMQRAFQSRKPTDVITDKMLSNRMYVGQILQVFPHAKIIWTRRDPRDTCLSCYTFDFTGSLPYCHDLRTLARYHNRSDKLMKFWQEHYPESVYAVDYEEMTRNPEKSIRELIEFCDLPWSDDYLRFHQVKRKITTASYNQVTQPIYTSATGRWKDYEKHLGPLLAELDLPNE